MNQINSNVEERVERITTSVRSRLFGRVRDFKVEMCDAGMVLKGRTRSYYDKQVVQHTALEVGHVPLLANEIQVVKTTSA